MRDDGSMFGCHRQMLGDTTLPPIAGLDADQNGVALLGNEAATGETAERSAFA